MVAAAVTVEVVEDGCGGWVLGSGRAGMLLGAPWRSRVSPEHHSCCHGTVVLLCDLPPAVVVLVRPYLIEGWRWRWGGQGVVAAQETEEAGG